MAMDRKEYMREYKRSYRRSEEGRLRDNARALVHHRLNRDKHLARMREYDTGWTKEQFEEAVIKQERKCACCGREGRLVADHDHTNKKPRELLCIRCNTALGSLEHPLRPIWDAYLEKHRG